MALRKILLTLAISITLLSPTFSGTAIAEESDVEDFFEDLFGIADNYDVAVDVKTDFRPGEEFNQIRATVGGGNVILKDVDGSSDMVRGVRVQYSLRENAQYRIHVELIKPDGNVLENGTASVPVSLRERSIVTYLWIVRPPPPPAETSAGTRSIELLPNQYHVNLPSGAIREGSVDIGPLVPGGTGAAPVGPEPAPVPSEGGGGATAPGDVENGATSDTVFQVADQNSQANRSAATNIAGGGACSMHSSANHTVSPWHMLGSAAAFLLPFLLFLGIKKVRVAPRDGD